MDEQIVKKTGDFFSKFTRVKYRKGETIVRAEDSPQGVFYILKGYVKMNSILEDGRELNLNILKPGCFFPMMWAIGDMKNSYFFQAITDVEFNCVPKNIFLNFIKENPDALYDFTNRILIGVGGLITNIEHILSGDARKRVASSLFILAKRFGETKDKKRVAIKVPIRHQDIADIAAITRETASITLKK